VTSYRVERRVADPRSATAAILSFLFPGIGQAYNGQWGLAALLAVPVLLIVGLAALLVMRDGSNVVSRFLDARLLIALIVLDAALLGWRLVAILQAHGERSRMTFKSWPAWITGVLVIATLAMHALPAYYAAKAVDTLGSVALEGGGALFDNREGRDVQLIAPTNEPEVSRGERVTVLLVGIDYAPGRVTNLTDTMLVATLDPETGEGAMLSVPRDLYGVPLPDGRTYDAKLNSLMSVASSDPAGFPMGGPAALKGAIGELLGTEIHYFAAIDLDGMRQLIDTVRGIEINVTRAINDPQYHDPFTDRRGFSIGVGTHHLNGDDALAYVRSRMGEGDNDFTRAERQQQVLTALAAKLTAGSLLVTLPGVLDAVRDNMATDVPSARIPALAAVAQEANLGNLERVVLTPPEFVTPEPFSAVGYILHPNLEAIRELARQLFDSPTASAP